MDNKELETIKEYFKENQDEWRTLYEELLFKEGREDEVWYSMKNIDDNFPEDMSVYDIIRKVWNSKETFSPYDDYFIERKEKLISKTFPDYIADFNYENLYKIIKYKIYKEVEVSRECYELLKQFKKLIKKYGGDK